MSARILDAMDDPMIATPEDRVAADVLALSSDLLNRTIARRGLVIRRDGSRDQHQIGYRGASLSHDDRDDASRLPAVDRLPDAPGLLTPSGLERPFGLIGGGRFTLISFGRPAPALTPGQPGDLVRILTVTDALREPTDVIDRDGHVTAALSPAGGTIVVVTPDGYVGLISDDADDAAAAGMPTRGPPAPPVAGRWACPCLRAAAASRSVRRTSRRRRYRHRRGW